ncbi:hypothetical protein IAD21_05282 [Abditibacteriota bacterium]|nr:hypothetical protein IAD21_05282 [Abditibacteriota bacterium]
MERPTVIVLVPVRNESWILHRFIQCTLLWADHIIIADQCSDDGSAEIASSYPRVTVVENPDPTFSEVKRQKLLLQAARQIPGQRLLLALDADEILSANVLESSEWQKALQVAPGTMLDFAKVNLKTPDTYFLHSAEDGKAWIPFGYMDDGAEHEGAVIHTCRIPEPPNAPRFRLNEVVLLHYNSCNVARNDSKNRWYRCFERLTFPTKSVVQITRLYDWEERLQPRWKIRSIKDEWVAGYREEGIDLTGFEDHPVQWWDWEILRMFKTHGTRPFRYLDIWSVDWEALRQQGLAQGIAGLPEHEIKKSQSMSERLVRNVLYKSRRHPKRRYIEYIVKRYCPLFK